MTKKNYYDVDLICKSDFETEIDGEIYIVGFEFRCTNRIYPGDGYNTPDEGDYIDEELFIKSAEIINEEGEIRMMSTKELNEIKQEIIDYAYINLTKV